MILFHLLELTFIVNIIYIFETGVKNIYNIFHYYLFYPMCILLNKSYNILTVRILLYGFHFINPINIISYIYIIPFIVSN